MYESLIKRHRPRGWRVIFTKRKSKYADNAFKFYCGEKIADDGNLHTLATCDYYLRIIHAPYVVNEFTLHILLHEFAHVHLKNNDVVSHKAEWECDQWAITMMKVEGLKVPKAILKAMRHYARHCIKRDEKAGEAIWPHIRKAAVKK